MASGKSMRVVPVDDRIFVRRIETPTDPNSKIVAPEGVQNDVLRGACAAVGPGMLTLNGTFAELPVDVGDGLIYPAEAALEITLESGKYDVVRYRDVICVLKN